MEALGTVEAVWDVGTEGCGACSELMGTIGDYLTVAVGGCRQLETAALGFGQPWAAIGCYGRLLAAVCDCGQLWATVDGCGRLWASVGSCVQM